MYHVKEPIELIFPYDVEGLNDPFQAKETPQINFLSSHESNDLFLHHHSCPQECQILKEERYETNAISFDAQETNDDEFELGFENVFSHFEDSQEYDGHSLTIDHDYWKFLGDPMYDSSNDGSIFSDALDQNSLVEEVGIKKKIVLIS